MLFTSLTEPHGPQRLDARLVSQQYIACLAHPCQLPLHSLLASLAIMTARVAVVYESRAGHAGPAPEYGRVVILAADALSSAIARQAAVFNGMGAAGRRHKNGRVDIHGCNMTAAHRVKWTAGLLVCMLRPGAWRHQS